MSQTLPPLDDEDEPPEPPRLRALRRLVTLLTVVLIVGMTSVAGILVWRLALVVEGPATRPAAPVAAPELTLPAGESVAAPRAPGAELLVLVRDSAGAEALLVYDRQNGALLSRTPVRREGPRSP